MSRVRAWLLTVVTLLTLPLLAEVEAPPPVGSASYHMERIKQQTKWLEEKRKQDIEDQIKKEREAEDTKRMEQIQRLQNPEMRPVLPKTKQERTNPPQTRSEKTKSQSQTASDQTKTP